MAREGYCKNDRHRIEDVGRDKRTGGCRGCRVESSRRRRGDFRPVTKWVDGNCHSGWGPHAVSGDNVVYKSGHKTCRACMREGKKKANLRARAKANGGKIDILVVQVTGAVPMDNMYRRTLLAMKVGDSVTIPTSKINSYKSALKRIRQSRRRFTTRQEGKDIVRLWRVI